MEDRNPRCMKQIDRNLEGRIEDLTKLWELYKTDPETSDEELGTLYKYGSHFDYVAPHTFEGQHRGYFRYQLSFGATSDGFCFFCDENFNTTRIEYWFTDWFGADRKVLDSSNYDLLSAIWQDFKECGIVKAVYDKAMANCQSRNQSLATGLLV